MAWYHRVSNVFTNIAATKGEHILALDIGTSAVKGGVFAVEHFQGGKMLLRALAAEGSALKEGAMHGGRIADADMMVRACEEVMLLLERAAGERVRTAIVGVGGGIARGITTTVNHPRENPKGKITLEELREMIHTTQWKALERIRETLEKELGVSRGEMRLLSATLEEVHIDGYPVANPVGFDGKVVQLRLFNVYTPRRDAEMLEAITAELAVEVRALASTAYALARSYILNEGAGFSALIIDIGGEITDITLVRQGEFEDIHTIDIGGDVFTHKIQKSLGVSQDEAEEIKYKYSSGGHLSSVVSRRITKVLERDISYWLQGVELALREFPHIDMFPDTLLLAGGGSQLRGIGKALAAGGWIAGLPFTEKPEVRLAALNDFPHIADDANRMRTPDMLTLPSLATAYLMDTQSDAAIHKAIRQSLRLLSPRP